MGYAYYHQGQLDQALDAYLQSIQAYDALRSSATVEEIKSGLAGRSADAYEYTALLLAQQGRPTEAFDVAERARAHTFLDQLGNRDLDIRAGVDPELAAREQELAAQIAALQSKLTEGGAVDYAGIKAQLESLQSAYGQVLVELKLANPAYASLVSADTLSVSDIQATVLDDQTSLVSYFLTDEATLAFVLDRKILFVATLPISRTRLAGQVERWRGLIRVEPAAGETQASDQIELAQDLYQTLIVPLLPHLRHHRLIIVPHQALHYFPLQRCWTRAGSLWSIALPFLLHRAPAAFLPTAERERKQRPLTGSRQSCASRLCGRAFALRRSRGSGCGCALSAGTLLTGDQATEAALRASLATPTSFIWR